MRICVYCSSSSAVGRAFFRAAREMGAALAERGHTLVYGGANVGLMGELAASAKRHGGRVIGVLPHKLVELGLAFAEADQLIVADSMAARKEAMEARAEAFIALPGGFGTLEDLLQAITLRQLGYLQAPIALVNCASEGSSSGFYDPLLTLFEQLYRERFAKPAYRDLYHVADTPAEALDYVEQHAPKSLPEKWFGTTDRAQQTEGERDADDI